ncbi:uncharacterized protein LOC106139923 [Amyelois transitella]|uniref:uncharacterized protein LOC106139923 n=1 Tax=Amyelois transitella TaxID=680683 RepID=UPI00299009D7|nr:uncharacterized protein LOC106139923 [Amyelois transitella]
MAKVFSEKQILTDMLLLYKERPCLWNPNNENYNHKFSREHAFMEILEKYQTICENATIESVKKKIDHMRCAYRRERKKVLAAREIGEIHRPVLWYFDHLTFLNDDEDLSNSKLDTVTYLQENEDGNYEFEEVPKKRSKLEEILLSTPMSPPQIGNENTNDLVKEEQEDSVAKQESEAFGRTIGLQLRELDHTQRYIAEKLISEVIFYGRLNQLRTDSSIVTD